MLGIAGEVKAPTYAELYSGDWVSLHVVGVWVNRIGKHQSLIRTPYSQHCPLTCNKTMPLLHLICDTVTLELDEGSQREQRHY